MAEENWEEQKGSDFWYPEKVNDELIGEVTGEFTGNFGVQYSIKKADGSMITTPSHKMLQSRLSAVKIGDTVKIVFTGEEAPKVKGQNKTKIYQVFIKRA